MPHCLGMCVPTDEYKSTKQLIKLIGVYMKREMTQDLYMKRAKDKSKKTTKKMKMVNDIFSARFDVFGWTLFVGNHLWTDKKYIVKHDNVWFDTDSVEDLVHWLSIMNDFEYLLNSDEDDFYSTVKQRLTQIESAKKLLDF